MMLSCRLCFVPGLPAVLVGVVVAVDRDAYRAAEYAGGSKL